MCIYILIYFVCFQEVLFIWTHIILAIRKKKKKYFKQHSSLPLSAKLSFSLAVPASYHLPHLPSSLTSPPSYHTLTCAPTKLDHFTILQTVNSTLLSHLFLTAPSAQNTPSFIFTWHIPHISNVPPLWASLPLSVVNLSCLESQPRKSACSSLHITIFLVPLSSQTLDSWFLSGEVSLSIFAAFTAPSNTSYKIEGLRKFWLRLNETIYWVFILVLNKRFWKWKFMFFLYDYLHMCLLDVNRRVMGQSWPVNFSSRQIQ